MTSEIVIRFPWLLPTQNVLDRMNPHQKRDLKDQILKEFLAAGLRPGGKPMKYAEITVWRHSVKEPDHANNLGSLKQLVDLLQPEGKLRKMKGKLAFTNPGGMSIILNDNPRHAIVRALWIKAPNLTAQHTLVRIRRLEAMPAQEALPEAAE